MSGKIKIALCLFGLPRCSRVTIPSLESNIIDLLRKCGELEVYYHLFFQEKIENPRSGESGDLDSSNYDFINPYKGILEPPPKVEGSSLYQILVDKGDDCGDNGKSMKNLLMQLHSLSTVGKQALASQPDVMVFARPDLLYHNPINTKIIQYVSRNPKACAIPDWHWFKGCNDRFAICGKAIGEDYFSRQKWIPEFCPKAKKFFQSEALLRYALKKGKAQLIAIPLNASRVRLGGMIKEELIDQCRWTPSNVFRFYLKRIYNRIKREENRDAPPLYRPNSRDILIDYWRAWMRYQMINRLL